MNTALDLNPDSDLDRVAEIAYGIAERIRDEDPRRLYNELVNLCHRHPAKAAQIVMAFAAWFDPDEHTEVLWARVRGIAAARTAAMRVAS
jgi:hypothetical protein